MEEKISEEAALADAEKNYIKTMQRCDEWDYKVMKDAVEAGGQQYANFVQPLIAKLYRLINWFVAPPVSCSFFLRKITATGLSVRLM